MSTLTFRARAGSLYWHVHVFENRKALREYERSLSVGDSPIRLKRKQFLAGAHVEMTVKHLRCGKARTLAKAGEILLSRQDLGVGTVTHECVHAAMAWARRLNVDLTKRASDGNVLVPSSEERFAQIVDGFVSQIYRRIYQRGLLVEAVKS